MQQTIAKQLQLNHTILIICNKYGHSSGMICTSCGDIPQCQNCDISIAYHQTNHNDMIGLCHICKTQYSVPSRCSCCHSSEVKLYGVGIQQVSARIRTTYGIQALVIDRKTVSSFKKNKEL